LSIFLVLISSSIYNRRKRTSLIAFLSFFYLENKVCKPLSTTYFRRDIWPQLNWGNPLLHEESWITRLVVLSHSIPRHSQQLLLLSTQSLKEKPSGSIKEWISETIFICTLMHFFYLLGCVFSTIWVPETIFICTLIPETVAIMHFSSRRGRETSFSSHHAFFPPLYVPFIQSMFGAIT